VNDDTFFLFYVCIYTLSEELLDRKECFFHKGRSGVEEIVFLALIIRKEEYSKIKQRVFRSSAS